MKRSCYLLLGIFLVFAITISPFPLSIVRAEVEPLKKSEMRTVTGEEGIELQFNLSLGEDSPMALSIQDGDGYSGDNTDYAYLGIEGLWLTMDVGSTDSSDAISVDIINAPNIGFNGAIQLSMEDSEEISGIQGGFDRAQVKYNITGGGGNEVIGMSLGDGNNNPGSLDFDGKLNIMGNSN